MLRALMSNGFEHVRAEAGLRPGQIVDGRYRVDHLIAEGGMARVWAGHNIRMGKRVALKVLGGSFAMRSFAAEMLRRESVAASKIDHPNVVTIFDVIEHEGLTCIVMELLQGESLAEYLLRRGSLSFGEAGALLLPAMRGVAAAYAQGVVHRDLKPGNIFLCRDSDGALLTTKVLDFGISKLAGRSPDAGSDLTDIGYFGTPAYMAPEDIAGATTVDPRTDVYGFGVLLFECVLGRRPFVGDASLALLHMILTEPAPTVASLRPDLPLEVQSIIDRALAKDPNDRFASVEQMMRAIEAHLMEAPTVPLHLPELSSPSLSSTLRPLKERTADVNAKALLAVVVGRWLARGRSLWLSAYRRNRRWEIGAVAMLLAGLLLAGWLAYRRGSVQPATVTTPSPPVFTQPQQHPFRPTLERLEGSPPKEEAAATSAAVAASSTPDPTAPARQERLLRAQRPHALSAPPRERQEPSHDPADPFEHSGSARADVPTPSGAADDDPFADYGRAGSPSPPR